MGTMTAQQIAAETLRILAEDQAKLVSWKSTVAVSTTAGVSQQETVIMVRRWGRVTDEMRKYLEDFLKAKTSVTNAGSADTLYVTDPIASKEVRSGRWRRLSVFSVAEDTPEYQQGIYETLIYWPTEYGAYGDFCAEASPLHHEDATIYLQSPSLATAAHADTVGQVISARNMLDGETGLWNSELRTDIARAFGPKTTWSGNASSLTSHTEWLNQSAAPYPTSALLLAALGESGGKTIRCGININRYGLLDNSVDLTQSRENNANGKAVHIHGTVLMKETATAGSNSSSLPVNDLPETPGIQTDCNFSLTEDGLLNWQHVKREARKPGKYTWKSGGTLQEESGERQLNDTALPTTTPESTAGKRNDFNFSTTTDGSIEWSRITVEDKAYGPVSTFSGNRLGMVESREAVNKTAAPYPTADSISSLPAGVSVRSSISITASGLLNYTVQITTSSAYNADGKAKHIHGTMLLKETATSGVNASALPADDWPQNTHGVQTDCSFSLTDDGLLNWHHIKRESVISATIRSVHGTLLSEVTDEAGKNLRPSSWVESVRSACVAGTAIDRSWTLDETGCLDWRVRTVKSLPSSVMQSIHGGVISKVTESHQRNAATINWQADLRTGLQAGTIIDRSFSLDEVGCIDWSSRKVESIPWPLSRSYLEWADGMQQTDREIVKHRRRHNDPSFPASGLYAPAKGYQRSLSYSLNADATLDWMVTEKRAVAGNSQSVTTGDSRTTRVEQRFWNQTSMPSMNFNQSAPGTIKSCQWQLTDYGLFDYDLTILTAIKGQKTTTNENADYRFRVHETEFWNYAQTDIPQTNPGTNPHAKAKYALDSRTNEFGLCDGTLTCRDPKTNIDVVDVILVDNLEVRIEESYYFNKEKTELPEPGSSTTDSQRIAITTNPQVNEFGLIDCTKQKSTFYSPLGRGITTVFWEEIGKQTAERMAWGEEYIWVSTVPRENHTITLHSSAAMAVAAISGGHVGSSWHPMGNGFYYADKVVRTPA